MQHKLNKIQILMFNGVKMIVKEWLHQLQTYFTLNPNLLEEDVVNFTSFHFKGDVLEW